MGKQVSQYDKILKENIEAVIPNLMQKVLGITAAESEELPDDIQHTKERKPDVLKKITDTQGNTFVLQIEFQVADEEEMVYRMAEYCIMLERRYKLPVRQFVVFLGSGQPQMPTQLQRPYLQFQFTVIVFAALDYRLFLQSDRPEEVTLAILAGFREESTEVALERILERVEETTNSEFSLKRHINQLRVLAQLRNLETILKVAMDSIAKHISEERDALYLRGLDKGNERFVTYLLREANHTDEQIAAIANVPVAFVSQIRQKLMPQ